MVRQGQIANVATEITSCCRPRTRSSTTIWSLPPELLLQLFEGLHVRDLLSVRSVHPAFVDLIDSHVSVWTSCTFCDVWPNQGNIKHFEKAAEHGNAEALIKLGVAYLYNEGLPGDFEGRRIVANGEKAAEMFCKVESLLPHKGSRCNAPFTWLFMRPPWAVTGACCKECVFNKMKQYANEHVAPSVEICIAKTLQLLDESHSHEILHHLQRAAEQGSALAHYLMWQHKYHYTSTWAVDRSVELQALRELRDIATLGDIDARLTLAQLYALGKYGGCQKQHAVCCVREMIQSSAVIDIQAVYIGAELTHAMRYILVDWLAEVASIKGFDSLTLHVAINIVDRFLKRHQITRARLQLLGVAAMVLSSRFLGRDIITIREAAWLTDNTYKYEDVVRMMGEISAVLVGSFRMLTSLDYTMVLGLAARNDPHTQFLAEYLCELALLHADLSQYPQGKIAAACQLLARISIHKDFPWSNELRDYSGFTLSDLSSCVFHLHKKCFQEKALMDHRGVVLQAVRLRYSDDSFLKVGTLPMLSVIELATVLGISAVPSTPSRRLHIAESTFDLIASPSRNSSKCLERSFVELDGDREKAATPTREVDDSELDDDFEDISEMSYERLIVLDEFDGDIPARVRTASDAGQQMRELEGHYGNPPVDPDDAADSESGIANELGGTDESLLQQHSDSIRTRRKSCNDGEFLGNGKRRGTALNGNEMKSARSSV